MVESTESVIEQISTNTADIIDWIFRIRDLWPIFVAVLIFFASLALFRRKCKQITKNMIQKYESTNKYIPGLFVELNDSKEMIRLFCFPKKWKQKVIWRYNTLFNDRMGKQLTDVYMDKSIKLRLRKCTSIEDIKKEIEKTRSFIEKIEKREVACNPDYKNTNMLYECFGGGYFRTMEYIKKIVSYLDKEYLVLTGTAGNGKSVMLCSTAEMLSANGETVLFLNARDINENMFSYIMKQMASEKILSAYSVWWKIQTVFQRCLRKNIYILIDAINENDSKEFLESIADGIQRMTKYGNVKFIVSCRSEYFDAKYKKFMVPEYLVEKVSYLDLQENEYSETARDRIISNYANHYNFTGELSESVKSKLINQLLLVRIFFETYSGQKINMYELNKYDLYKRYIDDAGGSEIGFLLKKLAETMMDNRKYENIPVELLGVSKEKYELIDSSILVCRDLIRYKGTLREESEEVVNFVYDEMRDYQITKHILSKSEDKAGNIELHKLKEYLEGIVQDEALCLEGVVNYLFNFFYSQDKNTEMVEFLLFKIIKTRDERIDGFRRHRDTRITSWGLNLIFETGAYCSKEGQEFIDYVLTDNPGAEAQRLLVYLIKQEMARTEINLNILLDAFARSHDVEDLKSKIDHTIANWAGDGVTVQRLVEIDKKIVRVNTDGANRFRIFAMLVMKCYDWNDKFETENYFESKIRQEKFEQYLLKLRESVG